VKHVEFNDCRVVLVNPPSTPILDLIFQKGTESRATELQFFARQLLPRVNRRHNSGHLRVIMHRARERSLQEMIMFPAFPRRGFSDT